MGGCRLARRAAAEPQRAGSGGEMARCAVPAGGASLHRPFANASPFARRTYYWLAGERWWFDLESGTAGPAADWPPMWPRSCPVGAASPPCSPNCSGGEAWLKLPSLPSMPSRPSLFTQRAGIREPKTAPASE